MSLRLRSTQYIGQTRVSGTKTYAGMELNSVAVNLDFIGGNAAYNKIIFDNLSNGIIAYNCALSVGNCEFTNMDTPDATYDGYLSGNGSDNGSEVYHMLRSRVDIKLIVKCY